ncbi:MAG: hypothetical protein NZ556_08105 [Fimbriimonadales bacterium]|nr:hypothetical protein [Fimbriimonadales bacterium]MCX7925217.1 hypothetical protein [Fimbriimonadales bacterium]
MGNLKNLLIILAIALAAIGAAWYWRQSATAPPEPSTSGYYEGPMKGKGASGGLGAGQ